MAQRSTARVWLSAWGCLFAAITLPSTALAEPPPPTVVEQIPPPPPPPGGVNWMVELGDPSTLPPPPPPPPGVVPNRTKDTTAVVESGVSDRTVQPEPKPSPKPAPTARSENVGSDELPTARPFATLDDQIPLPKEMPRRNRGLLALGIVLTCTVPVGTIAGVLARPSGDSTGKDWVVGVIGTMATAASVGLIVYSAKRMTPEEYRNEVRMKQASSWQTLLPTNVHVGVGSVHASWTF
ncbi:MAG: hypothetical protein IPK82_31630 [Polyangiaceae bacterium]|nr:hypothetical protein [Polyangiaceae bacterium]